MRFSIFLQRTKYLDRFYLLILGSASIGFQKLYLASESTTKIHQGSKKLCFLPNSKIKLLFLE